jgi:TatA/E family protein of Tat protein translocase
MGLNGVSMSELLIVLLIVALLFGTRRLRTTGTDLGTHTARESAPGTVVGHRRRAGLPRDL